VSIPKLTPSLLLFVVVSMNKGKDWIVDIHTAVIVLIAGILGAGLLAVGVSRWTLKYDRRARRKQQDAIRRRRVGGIDP